MALEQQDNLITDNTDQCINQSEKPQNLFAQLEPVPLNSSMKVSFYYIPHMSGFVEVQRIRKALLPFAEILVEHSIDLDTRHLTLYHHLAIDDVTVALTRLSLGAELQQTLSHYEPLEMMNFNTDTSPLLNKSTESSGGYFRLISRFLDLFLDRLKQWITCLQGKKDK